MRWTFDPHPDFMEWPVKETVHIKVWSELLLKFLKQETGDRYHTIILDPDSPLLFSIRLGFRGFIR